MSSKENNSSYVAIVGQTGAGKTTLANQFEARGYKVWREITPSEVPEFTEFYAALVAGIVPNPHVLSVQLGFLEASRRLGLEIRSYLHHNQETVIWEMPPFGHAMYPHLQHLPDEKGRAIMSEEDWQLYIKKYHEIMAEMPYPQIVLVAILENLATHHVRLAERARREPVREKELETPKEYWKKQAEYWLRRLRTQTLVEMGQVGLVPLIKADASQYNWVTNAGFRRFKRNVYDRALEPNMKIT